MKKIKSIVNNSISHLHKTGRLRSEEFGVPMHDIREGINSHISKSNRLVNSVLNTYNYENGLPLNITKNGSQLKLTRNEIENFIEKINMIITAHTLLHDTIDIEGLNRINGDIFPVKEIKSFMAMSDITRSIAENPDSPSVGPLISAMEQLMTAVEESPLTILLIIMSGVGDKSIVHTQTSEISLLSKDEKSLQYISATNAGLVLSFYTPLLEAMGAKTGEITDSNISILYPKEYMAVQNAVDNHKTQINNSSNFLSYISNDIINLLMNSQYPIKKIIHRDSKSIGTLTQKLINRNNISASKIVMPNNEPIYHVDLTDIHDLAASTFILDSRTIDYGRLNELGKNLRDVVLKLANQSDIYENTIEDINIEINPRIPHKDFEAIHLDLRFQKKEEYVNAEIIIIDEDSYKKSLLGEGAHSIYNIERFMGTVNTTIPGQSIYLNIIRAFGPTVLKKSKELIRYFLDNNIV